MAGVKSDIDDDVDTLQLKATGGCVREAGQKDRDRLLALATVAESGANGRGRSGPARREGYAGSRKARGLRHPAVVA